MIFPFQCSKCSSDKWMIEYNSEVKYHKISCVNCGYKIILEEVFGSRRAKKRIKENKNE